MKDIRQLTDLRGSKAPSQPAIDSDVVAADLYCDLYEHSAKPLRDHWPGLLVVAVAVLAANFLSRQYGAPLALMGLLLGLSLSFLNQDPRLTKGLSFASHTLLRVGIMLIGFQITTAQIVALGSAAAFAVIAIAVTTFISGIFFARLFGLGKGFGALSGGGVAICGASAAVAISAVLESRRSASADLSIVLVGISAVSAVGMSLYPMLAHSLGLSDQQAGFFLGASIHDVAQALGAGYSFSHSAGQTATIVKLFRVALLVPMLSIIAFAVARDGSNHRSIGRIPWFLVGFLVLVTVNSVITIPVQVGSFLNVVAALLIASAITAAGIGSSLSTLLTNGIKPAMVMLLTSFVAMILSLISSKAIFG